MQAKIDNVVLSPSGRKPLGSTGSIGMVEASNVTLLEFIVENRELKAY